GARQPGARQPGARQPGARQPGARQPGARQPEARQPYAGKHCVIGSLVGRAVRRAVGEGFRAWRDDRDRGLLDLPEDSSPC
ncbi:MAG: hypothetical protein AAF725_25195, partial [Acidobacteriota bacterium]